MEILAKANQDGNPTAGACLYHVLLDSSLPNHWFCKTHKHHPVEPGRKHRNRRTLSEQLRSRSTILSVQLHSFWIVGSTGNYPEMG